MAEQLIVLRGVPDDEADEIRQLLREHHFNFYETPGGNWGVSLPAIWLHSDDRFDEAKNLIAGYQEQRAEQARRNRELVPNKTMLDMVKAQPMQVVVYLILIIIVLYISVMPFLKVGGE